MEAKNYRVDFADGEGPMVDAPSSTVGAVRLRTVAVFDPHVVLDNRLVAGAAKLDVKSLRQQRQAAALLLARAAVLGTVIFDAQTPVVF